MVGKAYEYCVDAIELPRAFHPIPHFVQSVAPSLRCGTARGTIAPNNKKGLFMFNRVVLLAWFMAAMFFAAGAPCFAQAPAPAIPAAAQAVPLDAQAATQAYLDTVPNERRVKTDAYFEGRYWIEVWETVLVVLIAAALLFSGVSQRMRALAERVTRRSLIHALVYGLLFVATLSILLLPWSIYTGYFREHQYGLSNQTFGAWFGEALIDIALTAVIGAVVVAAIYWAIRKAPRTWWLWGAGLAVVFNSVLALMFPVFIAPLFNEYKPVANREVREMVLAMARANGVPADEVYEFNASKQHKRISANVSGFGGTMRIALNDNLLNRGSMAEIRMVMAHEIGHYALNHMYKGIIFRGLVMIAMFAFAYWVFAWAQARWGARWGVRGVTDVAGLPVLIAAFAVFSLLATPVNNNLTRVHEVEADLFGLNASHEPDGFALAALKLGEYRKMEPTPLEEFVFYTHPSGRSRIGMAMRWKAEQGNLAKK
jgi:STE24 endopeptidase